MLIPYGNIFKFGRLAATFLPQSLPKTNAMSRGQNGAGFLAAAIGFLRQWHYLGKAHSLLRKTKGLYQLPDGRM